MMIKITEKCSMGCRHCMNDAKPTGKHMSFRVFKDVVEFYKRLNTSFVMITGGEPFEHPECINFLEYFMKEMPYVFITVATNGAEFKDSNIKDFIKRCYDLQLPITFQVTTDSRYYPKSIDLTDHIYHLPNIDLNTFVPKIYPQGRALYNKLDWDARGSKCCNCRAIAHQISYKDLSLLCNMLAVKDKFCTPHITVNGGIKLGESDLCPVCSSIYCPNEKIMNDILNFRCSQCNHVNKDLPKEYLDIIGEKNI